MYKNRLQVSPSIAAGGTAINIVKPSEEELQHQQNVKVICDTLVSSCFISHIDWAPAKWTESVHERQIREALFETSPPDNQCLTSSRQFCWLKGNMRCWTQHHLSPHFSPHSPHFVTFTLHLLLHIQPGGNGWKYPDSTKQSATLKDIWIIYISIHKFLAHSNKEKGIKQMTK